MFIASNGQRYRVEPNMDNYFFVPAGRCQMTLYHGNLQVGNVSVSNSRGEAIVVPLISDVDGVALYEWTSSPSADDFTCTIGTDSYAAKITYV